MGNRSVPAWLILAVALAVPGVLFWNWLRQLNKPSEARRIESPGGVFGPTRVALPNPLQNPDAASRPKEPMRAAPAVAVASPAPVATPVMRAAETPALKFSPRIDRDPMLSLADMKRLRELALPPPTPVPTAPAKPAQRRRPPPVESLVTLSGITEGSGSIMAIVNDRAVREGDRVEVSGSRRKEVVTIKRITPTSVTFEHRTKRWTSEFEK